jgi:hypothetical protein
MIVPRRLIAQTRSKASSVISSSAAGDADPDIVVQDVDPSPARLGGGNRRGKSVFLGDVGGEGHAFAAFFDCQRGGLLGRADKPVDRQDPCAFLRKAQRGCTTIANALAGALPGPDDYSDLALQPHGYTPFDRVFEGCLRAATSARQPSVRTNSSAGLDDCTGECECGIVLDAGLAQTLDGSRKRRFGTGQEGGDRLGIAREGGDAPFRFVGFRARAWPHPLLAVADPGRQPAIVVAAQRCELPFGRASWLATAPSRCDGAAAATSARVASENAKIDACTAARADEITRRSAAIGPNANN